jgi:phosphate transport system substrate-binding protein
VKASARVVATATLFLAGAAGCIRAQSPQKSIRVWGYKGMEPVMLRWEAAYERQHPSVHFENQFYGAAAAAAGLYDDAADVVVMGREMWTADSMAFHWVFQYAPFSVEVLAAGTDAPPPSYSPVVIVNRENPLQQISMAQLDAIFGSLRKVAPGNLRQWNELGVDGALAQHAIKPVGFSEDEALGVFWRKRVLREDYKPNPASALLRSEADVVRAVEKDSAAIGYASGTAANASQGVKVIAVDGVAPTALTIANSTYPLSRRVSLYINRKPGAAIEPTVEGFLSFCLSNAAQTELRANEGYISLPTATRQRMEQRIRGPWDGKEGWKQ